ncbi:MAG: zinc ABC transporter substrate-binding protein [Chlamydiia bacterium]|nr:zinc ABC transporter substrate-binding protein [Chlamydiia bacterium]
MKKIFLLFVLLAVSCCKAPSLSTKRSNLPTVLVTVAPYQFLVEQICGDKIQVLTIAPPGVNPHSYEPTIRQVAELRQGVIWFQIGEPFEKKILPIMEKQRPELLVVDLRNGIDLIAIESGGCPHCCAHSQDRHIWLSPSRISKQAEVIAETLSQTFPEQKERFAVNLATLQEKISCLESELNALLTPLSGRSIVVSHPAFGYFCNDFHLRQLSIEQEGKEPRPRYLEKILLDAKESHASLALALPQYNNKGIEKVAEELNLSLHMIDPYAPDCLTTLRTLTQLILQKEEAKQ